MRLRILASGLGLLVMCVGVRASTWQVSYVGNELPEQELPWYRVYNPPGDTRTIEQDPNNPGNHWLVIDSRANPEIRDWAEYDRPILLRPLNIEQFYPAA